MRSAGTTIAAGLLVVFAASSARAGEGFGKLDLTKVKGNAHLIMGQKGFLEGQIKLAKDADLADPLLGTLKAVDATHGKTGGCFPNRRLAIAAIAAGARQAWKVPLVAGLQPVLDAFKAAKPGEDGHGPIVEALETAKEAMQKAGGAFATGLKNAIEFLKEKKCDLWAGRGEAPKAEEPKSEGPESFGKLNPTKVKPNAHLVMGRGFLEGQIKLSKDSALVEPLLDALKAVDATHGKAGGCFPNRRLAIAAIAAGARQAWKVPLVAGLQPVLDALKVAKPGEDGHGPIVEALEAAKEALEKAGGAFATGLRNAIEFLKEKKCDLWRR